jgi:Family of unknown function (DUF6228)
LVLISSARDGALLGLSRFVGRGNSVDADSFVVLAERSDLKAEAIVSAYMAPPLGEYFESMAACWTGWKGTKDWSSLEGEFTLSATSGSTGHITLSYFLRPPYTGFHWELKGALELEAGQLSAVAQEVGVAWRGMLGAA